MFALFVKKIMDVHKGEVRIKSGLGEGTTVMLRFKLNMGGSYGEDTGN